MRSTDITAVRRFNRVVTQRVGALDDRYLSRDRPLGEARVLWEIGEEGCDVRALRARLDLDSGYLSRLLRRLAARGGDGDGELFEDRSLAYQTMVREVIEAQRRAIVALRNAGEISNEVMHRLERELDLEDERLET